KKSNFSDQLAVADVVLASVYWRQNHISQLCQNVNVPCVYVSEYAFKTRCQMEKTRAKNKLVFLRRIFWHWSQERQHRRALKLANGLQANGTPTYNDYLGLAQKSLLYFDSRVEKMQMASSDDLIQRYKDIDSGRPLRLAFSGRLLAIKGADHLPVIAQYLVQMQVPFTMEICGDGELFDSMAKQIDAKNLGEHVHMRGVLDFYKQLIPLMKHDVDLFVCPHRQGDPSCTYLETMSCGVPIVGYDNAAFVGVCEHSDAGWAVPMDRPKQVAQQIAQLHKDRQQIVEHATESLDFAKSHSFEETFSRRVDQLIELARCSYDVKAQIQTMPSAIKKVSVMKEIAQ
ncbi:MAG: glycosyltransferase, partial [Phycisphaeraceae bacterium]|nr:glycosyltransferase [Phycisphaeraceae bacterium]